MPERIHVTKGDTLVDYTVTRHPVDGLHLEFTVHPHLQKWLQRNAEECVAAKTAPTQTFDGSSAYFLKHDLDGHGTQAWNINLSRTVPRELVPNLRLDEVWCTHLGFLRFCVDHLTRRLALTDTDPDLWERETRTRGGAERPAVAHRLDEAIKQFRLQHVQKVQRIQTTHVIE